MLLSEYKVVRVEAVTKDGAGAIVSKLQGVACESARGYGIAVLLGGAWAFTAFSWETAVEAERAAVRQRGMVF